MAEDETERLRAQLRALHSRLRREQPAVEGLSATEFQILVAVERAPASVSPGMLSRTLHIATSNVAAALRSLEGLELICRRTDPGDGRKTLVDRTKKGRQLVGEVRRSRAAWLRDAAGRLLTEKERRLLYRAGELMQRLADDSVGSSPAPAASSRRSKRPDAAK